MAKRNRPLEAERLIARATCGGGSFRVLTKGQFEQEYGIGPDTEPVTYTVTVDPDSGATECVRVGN